MGAKNTYGSGTSRDYWRAIYGNDMKDTTDNVSNVLRYEISCHLLTVTFMVLVPLGICITALYVLFQTSNPDPDPT